MLLIGTGDAHLWNWTGKIWAFSSFWIELLSLSNVHSKQGKSISLLLMKLNCSFTWTRTREMKRGKATSFPLLPKTRISLCPNFLFLLLTEHYCLVAGKKNTVFHQFPRLWELTKFLADFRKGFLDAKINVWLHYALGGEPAEFSHRGWEGLVLF